MKKPKIVIFNPKASLILPYDGPPLSILMAVSMIDLKDYDLKIVDWHNPNFREILKKECKDAMVFGVTCLTGYQIKGMIESARIAKESNPDIKVVCGGWHPTIMPKQTFQCRYIDYIIMGQGQRTFKTLVKYIKDNKTPKDVKGVGYRLNKEIIINERPEIEPLSNFPPAPYHLLDNIESFLVSTKFCKRGIYLLSSQGCPYHCGFCSEASFYKRKWSCVSIESIISTILDFKKRYNIDGVVMSDSNFFVDEKRVSEFCKALIPLKIKWGGASARADSLARYNEETWRLMKESGLGGVFIGTEAASNETLKLMNKECTIEDTIKTIAMAKKFNIFIEVPFIIGIPGSNIAKDFRMDIDFINRYRKDVSQFHMFVYTPFPGTSLITKAVEMGYRPPKNLEGWIDYGLHNEGILPWVPSKYSKITDQLSIYFQFLARNSRKVIEATIPKPLQGFAFFIEKLMYKLSDFRVSHSFFYFPVEYKVTKFVIKHRDKIFGRKNILF